MRWRQIVDPPAGGAWNMAVDEALLDACAADRGTPWAPTLRLYAWRPPCLSLGRGQVAARAHAPDWLRREGVHLVRRPSGGAAVLHEHERTYAVIGRLREPPFQGGVTDTYGRIARAVSAGLRRVGIETSVVERPGNATGADDRAACFAVLSPHEIAWHGQKLVGAAQLRRRGAFLQHGSIVFRADPVRLAHALGRGAPTGAAIDVERTLGRAVSWDAVDRALGAGFSEEFGANLVPGTLTAEERQHAAMLASWKYASAAWTLAGQIGDRERRWAGLG